MIHQTPETDQLRARIIDKYFQLGMEQGFSKVLLDQVATELSISKKTLYKIFNGKEHIIETTIDSIFRKIDLEILPIMHDTSLNIIDKLTMLPQIVAKHLTFFTRDQVVDIQHVYPQLWTKIDTERNIRIKRYEDLFRVAKERGYIINIEPSMIIQLFLTAMEVFTKETFLTEHNVSYSQSLQIVTNVLLEGILNKTN